MQSIEQFITEDFYAKEFTFHALKSGNVSEATEWIYNQFRRVYGAKIPSGAKITKSAIKKALKNVEDPRDRKFRFRMLWIGCVGHRYLDGLKLQDLEGYHDFTSRCRADIDSIKDAGLFYVDRERHDMTVGPFKTEHDAHHFMLGHVYRKNETYQVFKVEDKTPIEKFCHFLSRDAQSELFDQYEECWD
jgi:hypothetical protein